MNTFMVIDNKYFKINKNNNINEYITRLKINYKNTD